MGNSYILSLSFNYIFQIIYFVVISAAVWAVAPAQFSHRDHRKVQFITAVLQLQFV